MSRREGRESDRHRSKFDREPSPKRSRRDGKPTTERPSSNLNLDVGHHSNRDQKHRQRLQDALPLEEAPPAPDSKEETGAGNKEVDKRTNGQHDGYKRSANPTEVPRSRSYFQHDERRNAGQAGRTTDRKAATERGWWGSKDHQRNERTVVEKKTRIAEERDEKSQAQGGENRVWRHDGFYEIEANQPPPVRKRPFREKKVTVDSEITDEARAEPVKPSHPDRPLSGSERRGERGHKPSHSDRPEKPFVGDKEANRGEVQRGSSFTSRDRYGGGGGSGSNYRGRDGFNDKGRDGFNDRGRDGFNGRRGYRPGADGVRVEKWKHDLFEEANRSPTPKTEEDQVAKVEALLAS
ncbi:hypothetical protein U1Q18_004063 [Sarracenia purpurea var. burkii]